MSLEAWLAFAAASAIMLAIPGPTILLVVSYALGHGRKTALATVSGVALGDFTAMTASLFGLGALLAASATLFTVLKWIGGAYLIWLGIKLWRAPIVSEPMADNDNLPEEKSLKIFLHAYIVTALNPKSIVFLAALFPQFIVPHQPQIMQYVVLGTTTIVVDIIVMIGYATLATRIASWIKGPSQMKALNRLFGSLFVLVGALLASTRHA